MKKNLLLALVLLFLGVTSAQAAPNPILGYWQTQDADGVVEFYSCHESICGRFVWLEVDSAAQPSLDLHNSDPEKRNRPLCGLTFMGGFSDEGLGDYEGGWIYSPRHGYDFSAELHLKDPDTLELRGYVFFSFLGGQQQWHRVPRPAYCWALSSSKT